LTLLFQCGIYIWRLIDVILTKLPIGLIICYGRWLPNYMEE